MPNPCSANFSLVTNATRQYPFYVLGILWLVSLLRFVDLQIFAVLIEPIKTELLLSDTELAMIGGLAFGIFYGLLGIPIAFAADRFNRKNIIAIAIGLWSLMTTLCGMATGFWSLFLFRMGVGIGEAGAYPPITSLLSDYFASPKRALVFAIIASAIPVGVFTGFLIGGVISTKFGWRPAFFVAGLPGLAVAILVFFTVKEKPRATLPENNTNFSLSTFYSLTADIKILLRIPCYRWLILAACIFTMGAAGSGIWLPSFYMRQHEFSILQTGIWMAIIYGSGGLTGSLLGGYFSNKAFQKEGHYGACFKFCAQSLFLIIPLAWLVIYSSNVNQALCAHFIIAILMHINTGPVLTLIQELAGPGQRAQAQAINVLFTNIIALPLGPLFVAMIGDSTNHYGITGIGTGIFLLILFCYLLSGLLFVFAGNKFRKQNLKTSGQMVLQSG